MNLSRLEYQCGLDIWRYQLGGWPIEVFKERNFALTHRLTGVRLTSQQLPAMKFLTASTGRLGCCPLLFGSRIMLRLCTNRICGVTGKVLCIRYHAVLQPVSSAQPKPRTMFLSRQAIRRCFSKFASNARRALAQAQKVATLVITCSRTYPVSGRWRGPLQSRRQT